MRRWFTRLFQKTPVKAVKSIRQHCEDLTGNNDEQLKELYKRSKSLIETTAIVAVVAARVLGLLMFDVQLQGAVVMASGKIAEMQTGEGKTLAAVPAVAWYAKQGRGVHVMTANDYLAHRDAEWMGPGLQISRSQRGVHPTGHDSCRPKERLRV